MDELPFSKIAKKIHFWFKSQHFGQKSISDRYALFEACLIGIFSGLAALLLKQGVGWLGGHRLRLVEEFGAFPVLPLVGLILGALAGLLLEYVCPSAKGGGIAQVKASLARFKITLSLRVALTKIISTILVLGAGLTLGRRAPTVHIGAALAGELTRWMPTSPEHRRRMIAAGAAAGLAAGFNTPIAGVLFVVEELMRDVSNLTLETAIIASFTGSVVSLILQADDLTLPKTAIEFNNLSFTPQEIPFYLILGIVAGILGALFNKSILFSLNINQKLKLPLSVRIGITGLISGLIIASLPPLFFNYAGLKDFVVIGGLNWQQTTLTFVAQYFLTILAGGSGAPGGLFTPALTMGSALGYLMGDVEGLITGSESSATFALAGMGALFTGIVRVPVTAIVIVFELNTNFNLVLPLMISCAVAYVSAETLHKGSLDHHILRNMGMEFNEEDINYSSNNNFLLLKADEVMQSQLETVSPDLTMTELLELMSISHHRCFPVVEEGLLVGIVSQSDLTRTKGSNPQTPVREFMTVKPVTVEDNASLSDVLYLLNRYRLSLLPVLSGHKLVGIITRTDIIRAEVKELQVDTAIKPQISYTIYETRTPAVGRGVLLVPIEEDDDYHRLFTIASAIANYHNYEIEFVNVIKVHQYQDPRNTEVDTRKARHLMYHLERMGRKANISVHCKIISTHHRSGILLEIIKERHINMVLMGWKQSQTGQDFIFSHLIDNLINRATCELILVKLGSNSYPLMSDEITNGHGKKSLINDKPTVLIPMAGGPNALEGLKLLPALLKVYEKGNLPNIYLTKVFQNFQTKTKCRDVDLAVDKLRNSLKTAVNPLYICSSSVVDAITDVSNSLPCDLVILGASRDSLLKRAIHGNIPEAIASKLNTTVIIIRLPS